MQEPTMSGLAAGRTEGGVRASSPPQVQLAQRLLASPDVVVGQVAEMLHVSRQTPYQALKWVAEDTE